MRGCIGGCTGACIGGCTSGWTGGWTGRGCGGRGWTDVIDESSSESSGLQGVGYGL